MKYSDFKKFLESKDRFIDLNPNLSDSQKEEIKNFFKKHPNYENRIDWNKARSLTYEDFKPVLSLEGKSISAVKKGAGIKGLIEGQDYYELASGIYNEYPWHAYQPLTYYASRLIASDKVEPKVSAAWCTAWQQDRVYWDKHNFESAESFIYLLGEGIPTKKVAITASKGAYDIDGSLYKYTINTEEVGELHFNIWDCDDNPVTVKSMDLPLGALDAIGVSYENRSKVKELYKSDLAKTREIKWNEEAEYNPETKRYDLTVYEADWDYLTSIGAIEDGRFVKPIGKIQGSLSLYGEDLESLENGPVEVTGHYDVGATNIKSLKGAPRRVGRSFTCNDLIGLRSLEGAPDYIGTNFDAENSDLEELNCPNTKCKNFWISGNEELSSLKNGPHAEEAIIAENCDLTNLLGVYPDFKGTLDVMGNPIESLKGCPKKLKALDCAETDITSLEYAPLEAEYIRIARCPRINQEAIDNYKKVAIGVPVRRL